MKKKLAAALNSSWQSICKVELCQPQTQGQQCHLALQSDIFITEMEEHSRRGHDQTAFKQFIMNDVSFKELRLYEGYKSPGKLFSRQYYNSICMYILFMLLYTRL